MDFCVSPEFFLACLLRDREKVSFREINEGVSRVCDYLEEKGSFCVRAWGSSLLGAVQGSPDVFWSNADGDVGRRNVGGYFEKDFVVDVLGRNLGGEVAFGIYDLFN